MSGFDLAEWESRLRGLVGRGRCAWFDRSVVLEECESTQDEALRLAEGRAGLVVVAGRQTRGRGRLGRAWRQEGLGVAATLVLDASACEAGELSLTAAVAAAEAIDSALAQGPPIGVGLRWPNDVVAWSGPGQRERAGGPPKVAGCLIEQKAGLALVGIGINVRQGARDFPPEIVDRCTSLSMLGSDESVIGVIERLVAAMDRTLALPLETVVERWRGRDVLAGTEQAFEHDGRRYSGLVESIDPLANLRVRTESGVVELPALTTSLVRG